MDADTPFELLAQPGFGSVLIEAQMALYELPFKRTIVGDVISEPEARDVVGKSNPVSQLPTLIASDGTIMTESAAITLWLAEKYDEGRSLLVPPCGSELRPDFLRWLIYWVASPYATLSHLDRCSAYVTIPAARQELGQSLETRLEELILNLEDVAQAPWFLGDQFSALDIFAAVFSEWSPGRAWYGFNAPKISRIAEKVWAIPSLRPVYEENFSDA